LVVSLVSYCVMAYQVWFPIAILSNLRIYWIIGGVIFHLGIAFFMGLVTFSTVMIGLELVLISDTEYRWLGVTLADIWRQVLRRLGRRSKFGQNQAEVERRDRQTVERSWQVRASNRE